MLTTRDPDAPSLLLEDPVPGGHTDALWYLIASGLVPHMAHSDQKKWFEGFVTALETARSEPALRHSIGMVEEIEVAVRTPSPLKADVESLARLLFNRLALDEDEEDPDAAWADPGVREFWCAEAREVLRFLP